MLNTVKKRPNSTRTFQQLTAEVPMRNCLLCSQFPHLIEENMKLKLRAEILEAAVAERLYWTIGNKSTQ
ncbi:hypothetical protein E2C01_040436 [Portunus trituberculatus]|uniref:Uncharacterized protein n=1 Tax=Portunus trituberculatus TaxID=210409 RepID=A0A5B7FGN7_PORTR|nr:hypothetical protein [Portunus trituberculatus]